MRYIFFEVLFFEVCFFMYFLRFFFEVFLLRYFFEVFFSPIGPSGTKGVLCSLDSGSLDQASAVPPPNFSKIFPKRQKMQKHNKNGQPVLGVWVVHQFSKISKISQKFKIS